MNFHNSGVDDVIMTELIHFSSPSEYLTMCEVSNSNEFGKVVLVGDKGCCEEEEGKEVWRKK